MKNANASEDIILSCTGASGAIYTKYVLQYLLAASQKNNACVHMLMSDAARIVWQQELELVIPAEPKEQALALAQAVDAKSINNMRCYSEKDWFSPTASGSSGLRQMLITPCSMGSLARIATGVSQNLIERAADVIIKEGGRLIIVPRETPLSVIHLENMLKLAKLGVIIMPAMPSWYHRPQTLDKFAERFAQRVVDRCGIEIVIADELRWGM
ncbi:MAG: flavin prenyltransferase UbiX [Mariprofundales bacterium]